MTTETEPEVIEGTVVIRENHDLPRTVAAYDPQRQGAIFALGAMDEATFNSHSETLARGINRLRRIQRELLVAGTDHDTLGGETRTVLLKPGAEKLASFASLVATFTHTLVIEAFPEQGFIDRITYEFECLLHYGSADGPVVGQGIGICTSWENKYRWRNANRKCPRCGVEAILRSKDSPEWFCWRKRGGCGTTFADGTAEASSIAAQVIGKVEVDDPYEQLNTIAKMAEKRSFVDGVIRTLNASALFTQDIEVRAPTEGEDAPPPPPTQRAAARATSAARTTMPPPIAAPPIVVPAGQHEGMVMTTPEGVRQVKAPAWSTVVAAGSVTDKVELPIKVGGSKHTAIVLGPLARPAAEIQKDTMVRVAGTREEVKWAEDKPTKKEIRNVTAIWVDGVPLEIDPALPLGEVDHGRPHDDLDDGDLTVVEGGAATWQELPIRTDEAETVFNEDVTILFVEEARTRSGKPYCHLWLLPVNGPRARVELSLSQAEAEATGVYDMSVDQSVHAAGTWLVLNGRHQILGTAVSA